MLAGTPRISSFVPGTSINTTQSFTAGLVFHRTVVSDTNYVALTTDCIIAYTSLSAGRSVTLPITAGVAQIFIIKDESGLAGTDNITIAGASGTIDGSANKVINANYGVLRVYFQGTNYFTW